MSKMRKSQIAKQKPSEQNHKTLQFPKGATSYRIRVPRSRQGRWSATFRHRWPASCAASSATGFRPGWTDSFQVD